MCRSLLVTVGSTKFDKLIETVERESNEFQNLLNKFKIQKVIIQHGRSKAPNLVIPQDCDVKLVEYLSPKEMTKALESATVIISHGGAGTIFEILRASSNNLESLIIVENDSLMDSHQSELIEALIEMKCPIQRGNLQSLFPQIEDRKGEIAKFKLPEPDYKALTSLINVYLES